MAYRDEVLADSPLDFYEMETSTGTDSGSGGRTLTLNGGITTDVAGITGDGWTFDGTNDYASMGTFPSLTNAYSIEAWVKAPSAQGQTGDYHTVLRRNGTDIVLLRIRGSNITGNVNPGQAEVYIDGTTLVSGSSYRVDDGDWHHIVYTQQGNAAKLYIDGVQRATATTSQTTFNFGTGAAYIGSDIGTSEFFKGTMDNVAVYNTVLSPTRITAHYNSAIASGGYTAQVMTASATAPDATGLGNVRTHSPTFDTFVTAGSTTNNNSATTLSLSQSGNNIAYFKFPQKGADEYEESTYLYVDPDGTVIVPVDIRVYRVDADWDSTTIHGNNQPARTLIRTHIVSGTTSGGDWEIDITGADIGYGVAIDSNRSNTISSKEHATAGQRPFIIQTVSSAVSTSPAAEAMVADATMPTATGTGGTGVSPTIAPMTADAELVDAVATTGHSGGFTATPFYVSAMTPDATVDVISNIDIAAEPMLASALLTTGGGFVSPSSVAAEPFVASAETVDAAVSTQRGPRIAAEPFKANSVWKQPSAVNGTPIAASEVDDKFFQRVYAATPLIWFRLNDLGSTAENRMDPDNLLGIDGIYEGVQTGQFNAPDGRHSVHFDGTARIAATTKQAGSANSTLMYAFRTTKDNQFLMVTADSRAGTISNTTIAPRELFLKDGRIGYRTYEYVDGVVSNPSEFLGFRNLADGEWHVVVVRSTDTPQINDNFDDGVEIYIDGKFEVRRRLTPRGNGWTGFPDYIGSRPAEIRTGTVSNIEIVKMPALPLSQNFEGDMSEVVFFNNTISAHEISRHYYDFMGWTPIEAASMDAFAFTPADSHGRGNQKRALYLWWDREVDSYWVAGSGAGVGANDPAHNTMNFDPVLDGHGNYGTYDLEGYKVFSRGVTTQTNGLPYRDEVYDQPSLINLDIDVDLKDYDVILFGDWPDEGYEDDRLRNTIPNYTAEKERLINQLWEANARGVGLDITHPRLAVDMGYIDRVEFVPTLAEGKANGLQGNAAGLYDYGSAVKFPWNITADAHLADGPAGAIGTGEAMDTNPAYLANKAFYYADQNFNNKFRIRATVEGLTDIPSYMIKDAVYHRDYDMWGDDFGAFDLMDRRNGLVIGDEFIFHGTNPANDDYTAGVWTGYRTGRPKGYFAVPPANVKGGTVVTTFGATHWKDQQNVDNPYKDYATTIALQPGDTVGGRAVGGRVFISFTEQPNRFNHSLPADILPGSEWDNGTAVWPNTYVPDTEAQRNWDFSGTRWVVGNTSLGGRLVETTVTMPDGSTFIARSSGAGSGLVSANYTKLFGTAYLPRWDMTRRGLWWVGRGEKANEGDVRIAAEPMVATAAMPEPTVVAQRDAGYTAEPMRALAQMPRVAESEVGDVEIVTLPWTATADWTGFSRVISAGPMLATAELVENFDMVHASGEQVVLTLHGVDATLYLKEED